jgi:hypothetical protein
MESRYEVRWSGVAKSRTGNLYSLHGLVSGAIPHLRRRQGIRMTTLCHPSWGGDGP